MSKRIIISFRVGEIIKLGKLYDQGFKDVAAESKGDDEVIRAYDRLFASYIEEYFAHLLYLGASDSSDSFLMTNLDTLLENELNWLLSENRIDDWEDCRDLLNETLPEFPDFAAIFRRLECWATKPSVDVALGGMISLNRKRTKLYITMPE